MGTDTDDEGEDTYDVELSDASTADFALLLGGLGEFGTKCAIRGLDVGFAHCRRLTERLLRENPDVAREMLLSDDVGPFMRAVDISEETLDILDLEIEGGEVVPAVDDDAVDIEVE